MSFRKSALLITVFSAIVHTQTLQANELRLADPTSCATSFGAHIAQSKRLTLENLKSLVFENSQLIHTKYPEYLAYYLDLTRRSFLESLGIVRPKDPIQRVRELSANEIIKRLEKIKGKSNIDNDYGSFYLYRSEGGLRKTTITTRIDEILRNINLVWSTTHSTEERDFLLMLVFSFIRQHHELFANHLAHIDASTIWTDYQQPHSTKGLYEIQARLRNTYSKNEYEEYSIELERLKPIRSALPEKFEYETLAKRLKNFADLFRSSDDDLKTLQELLRTPHSSEHRVSVAIQQYMKNYPTWTTADYLTAPAERILRTQGDMTHLQKTLEALSSVLNRHAQAHAFLVKNSANIPQSQTTIIQYKEMKSEFERLNNLLAQTFDLQQDQRNSRIQKLDQLFSYELEPLSQVEVAKLKDGLPVTAKYGIFTMDELQNLNLSFDQTTSWDQVHAITSRLVDTYSTIQNATSAVNVEVASAQATVVQLEKKVQQVNSDASADEIRKAFISADDYLEERMKKYVHLAGNLEILARGMERYFEAAQRYANPSLEGETIKDALTDGAQNLTKQLNNMRDLAEIIRKQIGVTQKLRSNLNGIKTQLRRN